MGFNITVGKKRVVGLNTFYIYRTTDFCPTKRVDCIEKFYLYIISENLCIFFLTN